MRLSRDEYRRGLLSWDQELEAVAFVRPVEGEPPDDWSPPIEDPGGSVIPRPLGTPIQLRFGFAGPPPHNPPYPTRLERLDPDGAVRTRVWDRYGGKEVQLTLAHVPNYGYFHRMVIGDTSLVWDEDVVIRAGDLLVRFVGDAVVGEYAPPMTQLEASEGGYSVRGNFGTKTLRGRFIDIVAPGASLREAARRARGVFGLIALLFGDQAIGRVILENAYEALPRSMQRSFADLNLAAQPNMYLGEEAFFHLDRLVTQGIRREAIAKYVDLALHWYEQGCRARSDLDQFVAFFVGIETLFKGHAKAAGGIAEARRRRSRYEPGIRKAFSQTMEKEVLESIIGSLGRASQREEFSAYAAARSLPDEVAAPFSRLSRTRNAIVHGDATDPDLDDVGDTRTLLTSMLKAELGIDFSVPSERGLGLKRIHLPFDYPEYGWNLGKANDSAP